MALEREVLSFDYLIQVLLRVPPLMGGSSRKHRENCNRTQQCSILEVRAANVWAVVGRVGNAAWVGEGRDGNAERRSDTRSFRFGASVHLLEMLEAL